MMSDVKKELADLRRTMKLVGEGPEVIKEFIKDSGVMIEDDVSWEYYRDVYAAFTVWVREQVLLDGKLVPQLTNLTFSKRLGCFLPEHLKGKRNGSRIVRGYYIYEKWMTPERMTKMKDTRKRVQDAHRRDFNRKEVEKVDIW